MEDNVPDNVVSSDDKTMSSDNVSSPQLNLTQANLDKIVQANKLKGYEKGLREGKASMTSPVTTQDNTAPATQAAPAMSQADIQDLVNTQTNAALAQHQQMQQQQAQQAQIQAQNDANQKASDAHHAQVESALVNIAPKLDAAYKSNPEFKENYESSGLNNNLAAVVAANTVPNSAEVLNELAKSPSKLANFMTLAKDPSTEKAAYQFMNQLSSSIDTANSTNSPVPGTPLSNIKSSPVNPNSGGKVNSYKGYYAGKR